MADKGAIDSILKDVGAWQTGHFLLSSGLHSDQYVQCQKVLQYPRHGMKLAEELVAQVLGSGLAPQSVVGPALGAVHWELFVAAALDKACAGEPVRGIFAERADGSTDFSIRRGIEIAKGERILVVEDVTTTGGSARKVVDLVRQLGGEPVAVGAIVDRSGGTVTFDVPFFSLVRFDIQTFEAGDCRMCKDGHPLVKPGSSKKPAGAQAG